MSGLTWGRDSFKPGCRNFDYFFGTVAQEAFFVSEARQQILAVCETDQKLKSNAHWLHSLCTRKQSSIRRNVNQCVFFDSEASGCIHRPNTGLQLSAFLIQFPHLTYKSGLYFGVSKGSHFWSLSRKAPWAEQLVSQPGSFQMSNNWHPERRTSRHYISGLNETAASRT